MITIKLEEDRSALIQSSGASLPPSIEDFRDAVAARLLASGTIEATDDISVEQVDEALCGCLRMLDRGEGNQPTTFAEWVTAIVWMTDQMRLPGLHKLISDNTDRIVHSWRETGEQVQMIADYHTPRGHKFLSNLHRKKVIARMEDVVVIGAKTGRACYELSQLGAPDDQLQQLGEMSLSAQLIAVAIGDGIAFAPLTVS